MPAFELRRSGKLLGRLVFAWDDPKEWTTKDVRLEAFGDSLLSRQLARILERNEPRIRVAGRPAEDLGSTLEGIRELLWYVSSEGRTFEYSMDGEVPDREYDPLAES